jgi:hypothetical protein
MLENEPADNKNKDEKDIQIVENQPNENSPAVTPVSEKLSEETELAEINAETVESITPVAENEVPAVETVVPVIDMQPVEEITQLAENNPVVSEEKTDTTVLEEVSETVSKAEIVSEIPEIGHEDETPDYSGLGKTELIAEVEKLLKDNEIKKIDEALRPLKVAFDEIRESEKAVALQKFIADGGEEGDFELKPDADYQNFERLYRQLRERKNKHAQEQEKLKEQNYKRKLELLEKMRELVESEEGQESFNEFKKIQQEWKSIGVLPAGAAKELWANYEILTERYFANRTIYNELKDLDRKRNLTQKIEICEKAEKIAANEQITGQMMKDLNELHEEYKHVGPVPKDSQEEIWQRFKLASDKIYDKRRQQQEVTRQEWDENYKKKVAIIEEVEKFASFTTDKIGEWNEKTQSVLALQKQWDNSGSISREQAKEINKRFWAAFKHFFNNKGEFFRKLEEFRDKNLQEKTKLCEEAEALKDSEEFERTAERIKYLQQRWKEIGPVPEKMRDKIFERFKAACDYFFDRKRGNTRDTEDNYVQNLKKKQEICAKLEEMAAQKTGNLATLKELQNEYGNIGFVPKKDMQSIRKRFAEAVENFLENMPTATGTGKTDKKLVKLEMEIESAQHDPQVQRHLDKQEGALRKKLTQLENDVAVWKNNMEFFARSKNADSVRKEFTAKIEEAEKEIKSIKQQIRLLQNS